MSANFRPVVWRPVVWVLVALLGAATPVPPGAASVAGVARAADLDVVVGWLREDRPRPPTLSNLEPVPADEGLAGVRLGVADSATTGAFLGHRYALVEDEPLAADLVVVDVSPARLLELADAHPNKLFFNVAAPDARLRGTDCRANVLHTLPSRLMLADALAQFAVRRRWGDLALMVGRREADRALARAFERAAAKFGARVVGRVAWTADADLRRTAAAELPPLLQSLPDHDMLVVADEADDFARYVPFNTWAPRPVAGSAGLRPRAWSPAVEAYGAAQLQARFSDLADRSMRPVDWAAWAAVRAVGEAATRTGQADAAAIRAHLLSDAFELAAFKGRPVSFRAWNGQLRQPVPLAHPRALVAMAPLEGFLHRRTELDTLGLDAPESNCEAFQ